jgi:hypothetical protein
MNSSLKRFNMEVSTGSLMNSQRSFARCSKKENMSEGEVYILPWQWGTAQYEGLGLAAKEQMLQDLCSYTKACQLFA